MKRTKVFSTFEASSSGYPSYHHHSFRLQFFAKMIYSRMKAFSSWQLHSYPFFRKFLTVPWEGLVPLFLREKSIKAKIYFQEIMSIFTNFTKKFPPLPFWKKLLVLKNPFFVRIWKEIANPDTLWGKLALNWCYEKLNFANIRVPCDLGTCEERTNFNFAFFLSHTLKLGFEKILSIMSALDFN